MAVYLVCKRQPEREREKKKKKSMRPSVTAFTLPWHVEVRTQFQESVFDSMEV